MPKFADVHNSGGLPAGISESCWRGIQPTNIFCFSTVFWLRKLFALLSDQLAP